MITRKIVGLLLSLLAVSILSGCMMGERMMLEYAHDVEISDEMAMEAQTALMMGLSEGSVTLSDSHMSSLLTWGVQQDGDESISSITTTFDEDNMYISVELSEASDGIDRLGLVGNVMVENHIVMVDIKEVSAGPFFVGGPLMSFISDRINAALNDPALGTVVDVSTGEGTITISMDMMMDGM